MPDVSVFTRNASAIAQGEKIAVGAADDPFFVTTRGFSPAYRDGLARLRLKAARELNRNILPGQMPTGPDMLPPSVDDRCQAEALIEHCLIDVDGLTSGGRPVSFDDFKAMLPDNPALLALAIGAASRVGADRAKQIEEASGN